jgi:glyoxylase-like metal-dependent hydrolase (beta-lactamase superfamily II)
LADGETPTEAASGPRTERGLTYPLGAPPVPGQAVEAAPGVLWLRLPLPMSLDHINVYALADNDADGDGWTLVDTGLYTKASIAGWEAAFAGPLGGKPVKRVICTHMHPDHLGLAGWLCERFGVPLWMSRLEYLTARMLVADTGPAPIEGEVFFRAAGWDDERIDGWRREFGRFGKGVYPMPQSYRRLSEGDDVEIGGEIWSVVVGNGHCPEHVCLWRRSDNVFLSGDQILPRISSNVSVWPTEPLQDPLGDWMNSLAKLRALLPEDLFVLPSHGEPFTGVHTRIEALQKGHQTGLTRLERALREPRRVIDVFSSLFARPIGDGVFGMATGESMAHLNYLEAQGRARRERDADGVDWWSATPTDTEVGESPEEETTA